MKPLAAMSTASAVKDSFTALAIGRRETSEVFHGAAPGPGRRLWVTSPQSGWSTTTAAGRPGPTGVKFDPRGTRTHGCHI